MAPPSTDDFEISNYDVLADEVSNTVSSDESDIGLSLAAHSYHVGNNRLEVLCNIHNQSFSDAESKGEEAGSNAIVDKIMDIVQNQCVPKGRFLVRDKEGKWKEVEKEKARLLVRQALSNLQKRSTDRTVKFSEEASGSEADRKKTEDMKRRRRSSLLRRSVSSSMLPTFSEGNLFDDKKKASRKGSIIKTDAKASDNSSDEENGDESKDKEKESNPRPVFGRSQSVELAGPRRARRGATKLLQTNIIHEPQKMDILLNTAKNRLVQGTDLHGNNRLRVTVNIQTGGFQSADETAQTKMATDLVGTIEKFWGGRILCQLPIMSRGSGGKKGTQYIKLEQEHAIEAMKALLSGKAAEEEDEATMGEVIEKNIKQGRRASLEAIQSIAATGGDAQKSIMPSSLPTLPPDMQHLRSAAVKSLQKRKQRQGLNSRIRGLTADKAAIFQDGVSGNAGVDPNLSPTSIPKTMKSLSPNTMPKSMANLSPHSMPMPMVNMSQNHRQNSSGSSVASGSVPQPQRFRQSSDGSAVVSGLGNLGNMPHADLYRNVSSGASVASTVTNMSVQPPAGYFRQHGRSQGSVSSQASTSTQATMASQMSMNTMAAARTMANINLNSNPMMNNAGSMNNMQMMQGGGGLGMPSGAEVQLPGNMMMGGNATAALNNSANLLQQQQLLNMMPSVPEEGINAGMNVNQQLFSPEEIAQLSSQEFGLDSGMNNQNLGGGRMMGRNSLLDSTGNEDELPKFGQSEMEMLIKGLEAAENRPHHD